ncbi:MAG: hypothetical protein N3D75_02350, partial [Candidatus Aenigmarchaeota archaeon]|nr:hypothetical protein [Candidatus Aenigmarchaeota archaeon]
MIKTITLLFLLSLFFASCVSAQQSHPLSQLTPIDVNLNMNNRSVLNASWINATNVNSSLVCISNVCRNAWTADPGWTMSASSLFNTTANVGIGIAAPSARLHVNGTNTTLRVGNNSDTHLFVNSTTGRVGIGINATSPANALDVV